MGIYKLIDTPSGNKTLIYSDSIDIKLHSAYNPVAEAERNVNSFNPGRTNIIVVAGLGLGYHVKQLRKRFPEFLIVVIEKDMRVIDIARKECPENLEDAFIINSQSALGSVFEETDISSIRGASTYIHRPSYLLNKEFYDSMFMDIREYISSKFSDLLTRFEFEENWIDHIFKNLHHVFASVPVKSLFGKFEGMPGVIVSAGPSLRKNAKLLNDIKDKALVIAVDTAIGALHRFGVSPHIVMTLDSQKYSLKHFIGIPCKETVLLADVVSYPRLVDSYSGRKLMSTTSKFYTDNKGRLRRETTPVWDWVEKFAGPVGDIQSGGSVATSVFDLILNLGCSAIILVGQDLAYTGREIHCTGTYHNDDWLPKLSRFVNLESINQNVIRKRKIKYVDAYGGSGKVISDFVFDIYKYWFKDSAGKVKIPVMNATGGGARIENTIEKSLERIIKELPSLRILPVEILKSALAGSGKAVKPDKMIAALDKALVKFEVLEKEAEKASGDASCSIVPESVSDPDINGLITPFLRKTYIYLARNSVNPEKAAEIIFRDVRLCLKKIVPMLRLCKQNLEKIR